MQTQKGLNEGWGEKKLICFSVEALIGGMRYQDKKKRKRIIHSRNMAVICEQ